MSQFHFDLRDHRLHLPAAGWYPARIQCTRFRRSPKGNRMLQVVYAVAEVEPAFTRIAEYFVLEGTTHWGLIWTRRRLVDLFRAVGLDPQPDAEVSVSVSASQLRGKLLEVELGQDQYEDQPRLKVLGHRIALFEHAAGLGW